MLRSVDHDQAPALHPFDVRGGKFLRTSLDLAQRHLAQLGRTTAIDHREDNGACPDLKFAFRNTSHRHVLPLRPVWRGYRCAPVRR